MRFILIALPPVLPVRWHKIYYVRFQALNACGTHAQKSAYIKKHGSWTLLKKWLSSLSGSKCWYCESKSTRAPLDIDHFRPKLATTVEGAKLPKHHGYYWLTYAWWNFRISCQRCNRPENSDDNVSHGKANEFPIQDEALRCYEPQDFMAAECPKLLDPCIESDCAQLAHGVDGEVKPVSSEGSWEYQRADYTIKRLGFNEWNTPESKRSQWQTLATLLTLVGDNANPAVIAELERHISHDHEYSSFFRSAIGTHREKSWVEALL